MRRILLGIQAGMVLLFGGVGMQFVAAGCPEEASVLLSSVGVLAAALGLGFIASAVASYVHLLAAWVDQTPPAPAAAVEPHPHA